jgi:hypothetical protein
MRMGDGARGSVAVVWSWAHALLGAIYALPAAAVVLVDPSRGLALAIGVLPAAAAGLPGPRRARVAIALLGALMGGCILVGSLLAQVPVLAVPAIFALCVGAAAVASRGKAGQLALVLAVPLVGLGLSYEDPHETLGIALLMVVGSAYACVVSLLWPARPVSKPAPEPRTGPAGRRAMLGYGVLMGLAGSTAAAIGFLLRLDHVGWVCGAALMVMRPDPDLLRLRGLDRVWSVLAGATAGCALVLAGPPPAVVAAAVVVALAALAATKGSRRYVTPMFTTFLVFLLLLVDRPEETAGRFLERTGETLLGVALAVVFGLVVPALLARRHRPAAAP